LLTTPIRVPLAELPAQPAPELGADTDSLLAEIGYGEADRARLRDAGVI
jgi:crotonobetainyl-CoA:carnitine CoA-transferase CaiB-like acyl-CoA transferase